MTLFRCSIRAFVSLTLGLAVCLGCATLVLAEDPPAANEAAKPAAETAKPATEAPSDSKSDSKTDAKAASKASDSKASESQEPVDPTQDIWNLLLQKRVEELGAIDAEAASLLKRLPGTSRQLKEDLGNIESEYQRLVTISRVSRGLPLELSVVQERLVLLGDRLSAVLDPFDGTLSVLKTRLNEISLLEQDTPAGSENEGTPELRAFMKDLAQAQTRLATLQSRLNRVLTPARKLGEGITGQVERLTASIPGLWQGYYLNRAGRLYDVDTWASFQKSISVLQETFALRMNAEVPTSLPAWLTVLLRGLVLFFPLQALIFVGRRLAQRWPDPLRTGCLRMSTHSLIWLSFGFTFHFAAWAPNGGSFHVLSVIGTLLLSLGQMAFAWDMYTFERTDLQRHSPLWPLFAPLLAGLVLLLFNLPGPMLGGLWLLILLVTLWRDWKRVLPDIPFPLVINLLKFQSAILWVAVIMTLIGWGRLSILVCMTYAALAVCVQQAVGFMRITNLLSERLPQQGFQALLSSFVLALALPAMLVLATMATGLWILAYPGGQFLLSHIANLDFSIGKTTFNAIQILFIFSAFYVTRTVVKVGRAFIQEMPAQGVRIEESLLGPIQVGFTYLLWVMFGLYTLSALGFSLTSLAVVAGGLSVGIGFGLQNIINNFVSGLLMIFGQTLREGDVIEVGQNLTGTVKKINVRSTIVETPDNAVIFVPNAEFLSGRLTNWTRNGRMVRLEINVGVAYGTDVQTVIRLLHDVARDHPKVLSYPEPLVLFKDFGPSALEFGLRFWVGDILHGMTIATELRIAIDAKFSENNVEISFPQLDVHVKEGLPSMRHETVPSTSVVFEKESVHPSGEMHGSKTPA